MNTSELTELDWTMIDKLAEIVLTNVPESIVDIGISGSTTVLSRHAKNLALNHYACDSRPGMCTWARANNCNIFEGKPLEFIEQFPDISVALVVVNDAQTPPIILDFFLEKLAFGGVILLRDHIVVQQWLKKQTFLKKFDLQIFVWPYAEVKLLMVMKNASLQAAQANKVK